VLQIAPILFVLAARSAVPGPTPAPTPAALPEGTWGGAGLRVSVTGRGATIEFDAATGKTDGPLSLDGEGRFDVAGTLARQRPGPTRSGQSDAPGEPVRFRGRLEGETLTLEVVPAGKGAAIAPLKATRGAPARLRKMA
jgi:hypothetical protein